MEGLQRSAVSFRRQGSSGMIWDDKFLSEVITQAQIQSEADKKQAEAEAHNKEDEEPLQPVQADADKIQPDEVKPTTVTASIETIHRSRSTSGDRAFRTGKVSPAIEPPSPKFSTCGFCTTFGKTEKPRRRAKCGKRRT